jgi:hypothetical protein
MVCTSSGTAQVYGKSMPGTSGVHGMVAAGDRPFVMVTVRVMPTPGGVSCSLPGGLVSVLVRACCVGGVSCSRPRGQLADETRGGLSGVRASGRAYSGVGGKHRRTAPGWGYWRGRVCPARARQAARAVGWSVAVFRCRGCAAPGSGGSSGGQAAARSWAQKDSPSGLGRSGMLHRRCPWLSVRIGGWKPAGTDI